MCAPSLHPGSRKGLSVLLPDTEAGARAAPVWIGGVGVLSAWIHSPEASWNALKKKNTKKISPFASCIPQLIKSKKTCAPGALSIRLSGAWEPSFGVGASHSPYPPLVRRQIKTAHDPFPTDTPHGSRDPKTGDATPKPQPQPTNPNQEPKK